MRILVDAWHPSAILVYFGGAQRWMCCYRCIPLVPSTCVDGTATGRLIGQGLAQMTQGLSRTPTRVVDQQKTAGILGKCMKMKENV